MPANILHRLRAPEPFGPTLVSMVSIDPNQLLTASDSAMVLQLSGDMVRVLMRERRPPTNGTYLFSGRDGEERARIQPEYRQAEREK
jgi:hypothetical protein